MPAGRRYGVALYFRHGGIMRIRTTSVALAAVVAFTLAGCSSSGDSDANAKATPPATTGSAATPGDATTTAADDGHAALTAAVRAYSAAYFKPDPDAAATLLSDRCQRQTSADAYREALKQAVATYGHQEVKTVTVDRLSGDMALVSYAYSVPVLARKGQPWVRERGQWRYDAC